MFTSDPHYIGADVLAGVGLFLIFLATALSIWRSRRERDRLAEISRRLELALKHMGQGLAMFDAAGRVTLHNSNFRDMLGLPPELRLEGLTHFDIVVAAAKSAGVGDMEAIEKRAREVFDARAKLIKSGNAGELVHTTPAGRTLRVTHTPVEDGAQLMIVEDITERRRSEAELTHLSKHDALTGMPNRARFLDMLDISIGQVGRSGRSIAVVLFDLDSFSAINDAHGFEAGDIVIKTLADRLRAQSQVGEAIARLGGDEFGAIKSMNSRDALEEFLPRLIQILSRPVTIEGTEISLTARMGVATYPEDSADGLKLMANAELALQRAKAQIPGTVCLYDSNLDEMSRQLRDLAVEMGTGLAEGQFHVAFQVQKTVETGETTGYEALLRWNHPRLGPVPPSDFIPLAEKSGQISAVGAWVLEAACREAVAANLEGRIAVNLSPLQLSDPNLPTTVSGILERTGMSPERLELEVTETALIAGKETALDVLKRLQDLGIDIALDDFGTGYSSLETLRSFPFDKIKLDRSFMAQIETSEQSRAIMRAVIALGKALHTPVLAEGVETEAQLAALKRKGCDLAQGYYFGRPVPIAELTQSAVRSAA